MLTCLKEEISKELSRQLKGWLQGRVEVSESQVRGLLEVPKSIEYGHLALPLFFLAKPLKKAPPILAKEFAEFFALAENLESAEPTGGYLNFKFKTSSVAEVLLKSLAKSEIGFSHEGKGKKIVIDFSSPNVAKQMNIGHLRATVIGQAILNLALTQGYEVVGLNHLGDWGSQFGKLAWAVNEWEVNMISTSLH